MKLWKLSSRVGEGGGRMVDEEEEIAIAIQSSIAMQQSCIRGPRQMFLSIGRGG